jgi:S-adenosylmethionine:tRNA ribosyltransferase-isomerase
MYLSAKVEVEPGMSELDQYDYHLPRELIAQYPLARRADARLLVVDRRTASLAHTHVRELPEILAAGDCLVLNDTRVIPAQLIGYRNKTSGRWFGLFLAADELGNWRLLCKTRGKLTAGESITLIDRHGRNSGRLTLTARLRDGEWIARPVGDEDFSTVLERVGRVPLPHYIRGGEMVEADREAYQTVFAESPGAVAAPTAGLHFTESLLNQIQQRGIGVCRVTLHVGVGTFRPISAERLSEHRMHREWGRITAEAVQMLRNCRSAGGRIVAVGTTCVRLLETGASNGCLQAWCGQTDLFIRPPYQFRAVDALMTNFHLPRSTLLVLVRTFGGDRLIRHAYDEAIREGYRFFSYGDAMLVL